MAHDRTTANNLMAGIKQTRQQALLKLYLIGLPTAIVAAVIFPYGTLAWALVWIACFLIAKRSGPPHLIQGAKGEARVQAVLSGLPAEYTLYNQIRMPDARSKTGFREADFIIVGPTGCVILENKDYRGTIVGDERWLSWEQHKVGRGGTSYVTSGRNPVRQVQTYVALLAGIFRARGIKAWITPLVSLSRDNSLDGITATKVKVVQCAELCATILAHRGTLTAENRAQVVAVLEELRTAGLESVVVAAQPMALPGLAS